MQKPQVMMIFINLSSDFDMGTAVNPNVSDRKITIQIKNKNEHFELLRFL